VTIDWGEYRDTAGRLAQGATEGDRRSAMEKKIIGVSSEGIRCQFVFRQQ
jgi:hypothetical protein